ncbi:MAG: GGDEF domain-containing protein [Spirochaetales bacterium]|nr:GGDEF domain-containing protein [Spirochaetales bacterium]
MNKQSTPAASGGAGTGVLLVLAVVFGLLGGRAWLATDIAHLTYSSGLRVAVPVALFLSVIVLSAASLFRRPRAVVSTVFGNAMFASTASYVVALILAVLDVLAGYEPYLLIAGMAVYGAMAWNHPRVRLLAALAASVVVVGVVVLARGSVEIESACGLIVAFALALFSGDVVKRSVLPSEERLRSLEVENQELWKLSYRDGLTGLYNRRYLEQIAHQLFSRALRYKEPLHVMMLDIDHFKRVNDKLGHPVGDEVLKTIAVTIQAIVRTSDVVSRYGGEEFLVILVQSNSEITQFIANRIRDGVASTQFAEVPWQVTISIGVAGLQDGDTVGSLIDRADQFLYASKHHGRNRVSGF